MKYTQIPTDTFQKLQLNAGILVDSFTPSTGVIGNILGATTGGVTFNANPTFTDFGEDIDNCPNNMMELKKLSNVDPTMSGNFLTCSPALAKRLAGAADISGSDQTKVIPRRDLLVADFSEVWWIGDYSDVNTGENAGYLAIRLINALNQAGFQITSSKDAKGQLAFEFHGHYSIDAQETVPYEIYVKSGSVIVVPSVTLDKHVMTIEDGETADLIATVIPAGEEVTWEAADSSVATVSDGTVTAEGEGNTIITASITVDEVTYSDTCTVIVTAAPDT